MPILHDVEQTSPEWDELRKGKVTGSKLKSIIVKRGTKRKLGFYELIAERLGVEDDSGLSSDRDRGSILEEEARQLFVETTGKNVETVGFVTSDENEQIGLSPDGIIKDGDKIVEAVEIKCLSSARHLQAYFENSVPDDLIAQVYQYFIVLPDLETLHYVLFDPRITAKPYHVIEIHRDDIEPDIDWHRDYQVQALNEIDEMIQALTF